MSVSIFPFAPSAALARISKAPIGWRIDCCSPHGSRHYGFLSIGDAAEFGILLRDEGKWQLRFGASAAVVRALIAEFDE